MKNVSGGRDDFHSPKNSSLPTKIRQPSSCSHRTHDYSIPGHFHSPPPFSTTQANRGEPPSNAPVTITDDQPILNHPLLTRGDLLIRGLMHKATDTILDFQVVNLGSASYHHPSLASAFAQFERSKNKKHKRRCVQHRRDFAPFIAS